MATDNDYIFLVGGESKAGKSASLRNLKDPEGVMFLNCEANKKLTFSPVKFQTFTITDPYQIYEGFEYAEKTNNFHTIVIDTITFLMDMFESVHVLPAKDTMKG